MEKIMRNYYAWFNAYGRIATTSFGGHKQWLCLPRIPIQRRARGVAYKERVGRCQPRGRGDHPARDRGRYRQVLRVQKCVCKITHRIY